MKYFSFSSAAIAVMMGLGLCSCEHEPTAPVGTEDHAASVPGAAMSRQPRLEGVMNTGSVAVFATGFNCPHGLKFGPDGYLYVAEGGLGGTSFISPEGDRVNPPIGPYTGGLTGRISRVSPSGTRTTVAEDLPSCQTSPQSGRLCGGVADVEFIGNSLFALLGGAGPSHGISGIPNSVIRVQGRSEWSVVADLSQFLRMHPVAAPPQSDFEPDGTWYSLVLVNGDFYAVEPNHGELDRINPNNGGVDRVADFSATQGHCLPTALAYRDGYFYVGTRSASPFNVDGQACIYRISPAGGITNWATGFTSIVGLAFDNRGRLYVLENSTGAIVRVNVGGWRENVLTGLSLPTAITVGPDGALYVSNKGLGPYNPGVGEILRIAMPDDR